MNQPIETQAVVVAQPGNLSVSSAMRLDDILAQVKLIQDVMHRVMKEKEHYGTIPGCGDKKTLLQPGAQKLTMTFRLAPSYDIQETDLQRGHREYRVTCTLKTIQAGSFVGQGVGCCSTMESKYRWRQGSLKCPDCGKETIFRSKKPEGGWFCWAKKGGCGVQFGPQAPGILEQNVGKVENENPADCYNTVLKIAKKRAFVDATITATAASDIFTQDVGDDEGAGERPPYHEEGSTESFKEVGPPDSGFDVSEPPKAKPEATKPATPTTKTRSWAIQKLGAHVVGAPRSILYDYLVAQKWIKVGETVEAWPLEHVPGSTEGIKKLLADLQDFEMDMREGRTVAP